MPGPLSSWDRRMTESGTGGPTGRTAMTATNTNTTTTFSHRTRMRAAIAGVLLALVVTHPAAAVTWSRGCPADRDEQLPAQDPAHGRNERHHDLANRTERLRATDRRRRQDLGADADPRDRHLVHGLRSSSGANVDLAYVKQIKNADGSTSRRLYSQAQHERRSDIRARPADDLDSARTSATRPSPGTRTARSASPGSA